MKLQDIIIKYNIQKKYLWHFAEPKPWKNRLTAKHLNA